MSEIKKISRIDKNLLSKEQYFQSLLEQAWHAHLISDTQLEKIQSGCLAILAKTTEKYNQGDSSSIRVDIAQNMLTSVTFTIGIYLKTFDSPDDAVDALCKETSEVLYHNGLKEIDKMVNKSKLIHARLARKLFDTPNVFYRSTIIDGINGFFKLYRPDFFAQEIHITADYPTHLPISGLAGIEFIRQYLENLYYENAFLNCFSSESIHHILCSYDAAYEELLFNLYEIVLTTALGCVIAQANISFLALNATDINHLAQLFKSAANDEIEQILLSAADELGKTFSLSNSLLHYMKKSIPQIVASVKNASETHTLDKIFLIPKYPENIPAIKFSFGERMDDECYRKIVDELIQCDTTKTKIEIIKQNIHSFADLEDILLDAELTESDISAVLKELSLTEIAALTKKYAVFSEIGTQHLKETETILSNCLKSFIETLSPQKQAWIVKGAEAIELTD